MAQRAGRRDEVSGRSGMLMGHPTLNANVRAAGDALAGAGLLAEFHTTLDTTALLRAFGPSALGGAFTRRSLSDALHLLTKTHPTPELRRLATQRFGVGITPGVYPVDASSFAVDRAVRARITSQTAGVYAYEDSALFSFQKAAEVGIPRIYDLPIGYWRAGDEIYAEEAELQPGWAGTIPARAIANREERQERKDSEISLATRIIVASSFTLQTLSQFSGSLPDLAPIVSIPYGVPTVADAPNVSSAGPVRVLYVGGLTQRKGISYLFDAARALGSAVELTVVGRRVGESVARDSALSSVRWIESLPHQQVLRLMRESDVLVLPSLFEGFGLVLTEAMSQGTPIIATDHTAAPDLITDGLEGWIVPLRSSDAIAERLSRLVEDIDLRNAMKQAALDRAAQLSWSAYRDGIVATVREALEVGR